MTYEADARGYRVKATAAVTESDLTAAASTTTTRRTAAIVSVNKPKHQEREQHHEVDSEPTDVEALELEPQTAIVSELVPLKNVGKLLSDPASSGQSKHQVGSEPAEEGLEFEPQTAIVSELVPLKNVGKLLNDPASSGQSGRILFREPKANHNIGSAYHLGYPFMSGNFIYAL